MKLNWTMTTIVFNWNANKFSATIAFVTYIDGILPKGPFLAVHYGNQSRGYFNGGRPLWPPAEPRLAARPSQSNPRGSGPEVLKRELVTWPLKPGVSEVEVFRAIQPNGLRMADRALLAGYSWYLSFPGYVCMQVFLSVTLEEWDFFHG